MIGRLSGKVIWNNGEKIIIDVNGVGYEVFLPAKLCARLQDGRNEVELYVYTQVRDDAIKLFGFENLDEKEMFEQLISVSNVGPKVALSIISRFTPDEFSDLLEQQDLALLTSVPGVGEKLAKRIIVELRGKIDFQGEPALLASLMRGKHKEVFEDAKQALLNLGFTAREADQVLIAFAKGLKGDPKIEDIVRFALSR